MNAVDVVQGSPEWFAVKCGRATASRVSDVCAKAKTGSGYGASRHSYMAEKIVERLTGLTAEHFTNGAMQWGREKQSEARAAYELEAESWVSEVGFVIHPTIFMSGASPDGLVGDDGLVEFKCPNTATHIETLIGQPKIDEKYNRQIQFQLACTGRSWCDFVSFDPRLPKPMQLWVKRVERDPHVIAFIEEEIIAFLAELDEKLEALRKIGQ